MFKKYVIQPVRPLTDKRLQLIEMRHRFEEMGFDSFTSIKPYLLNEYNENTSKYDFNSNQDFLNKARFFWHHMSRNYEEIIKVYEAVVKKLKKLKY